jgi:hypothetical protein
VFRIVFGTGESRLMKTREEKVDWAMAASNDGSPAEDAGGPHEANAVAQRI